MKRSRLAKRQHGNRWQPLQPARSIALTESEIQARLPDYQRISPEISEAELRALLTELANDEVWRNDQYQVHVRRPPPDAVMGIVHLSIRRLDRGPSRDWRDFQRIKNQLVGPENEGIELYPAESRVVDLANQYHLFVFADPTYRVPIGWDRGRHVESSSSAGAVQRPFEEDIPE